ncbi:hypothetical protein IV38_GL002073 [Lactobacillus selangorensis]|uniref:Replication initiation control protein YabA n=1 Tax=Lactobacillus selangorensis TaxID=81857 RepID=A0A0R2FV96_9LACO|nr:DNA replication initiation control protein YabA [Lactobacillus selangorensis]KRN27421.1 hypothetical protein IV38_GL002073 [Lactobacillus selangorensis]KRN31382.1 hypothetical protein IV40_GL001377 [Lactobacillus selangorensis]
MKQKNLYDSFLQLEQETQQLLSQLDVIKETMSGTLEKDAELEIENEHLRQRLEELQKDNASKNNDSDENGLSKSKQNLEKLYEEGYHVCREFYGSRRENDESCMFCTDTIYEDHH